MARSFPVILDRVRSVAFALVKEQGEALAKDIGDDLKMVRKAVAGRKAQKVLFLFNPSSEKITAGGKGTGADEFIRLVGLENVAGNLEGWKPLTKEAIVEAAPEILVAASNSVSHNPLDTVDQLLTIPGLDQTPAGKAKRVLFVDASKFLGGGPRAGLMAMEFATAVYPDLKLQESKSSPWFQKAEQQHK